MKGRPLGCVVRVPDNAVFFLQIRPRNGKMAVVLQMCAPKNRITVRLTAQVYLYMGHPNRLRSESRKRYHNFVPHTAGKGGLFWRRKSY